jgi:hypothetical protein
LLKFTSWLRCFGLEAMYFRVCQFCLRRAIELLMNAVF